MDERLIEHYKSFSLFTYPGCYLKYLKDNLPDNIEEIGYLIRKNTIHRAVLKNGNTQTNTDLRYGDMTKVLWYRVCEDDVLPTASAMISELFRRDGRGFVTDRNDANKIIVTCRNISILTACILKAKGYPTRVRSGFAAYFQSEWRDSRTHDHWINQYWSENTNRWVTIDVDGSIEPMLKFNPYDIPDNTFDFSADSWLRIRNKEVDEKHFFNEGGTAGLIAVAWELFYDFHCLMNEEPIYLHTPEITWFVNFPKLAEADLKEIDSLAKLMQHPDENFDKLTKIWNTNKKFRLLRGGGL